MTIQIVQPRQFNSPIAGAFSGLNDAVDSYMQAKRYMAQMQMQRALQGSEVAKNNAAAGYYGYKTGGMQPGPDGTPNPMMPPPPPSAQQQTAPYNMPIPGAPESDTPGNFNDPSQANQASFTMTPGSMGSMAPGNVQQGQTSGTWQPGQLPGGVQASPQDQVKAATQMALLRQRLAGQQKLATSGIGRGQASILRSVLNTGEQNKIDTLPGALAIHNNLVDVWEAYNKAAGDAGVAVKILQSEAAKNPALSQVNQQINGDPAKLSAVYNSMVRQAASEQYKLVNGSNAAPPEDAISHNIGAYPQLGDDPQTAAMKFNTLVDTQIRPAMAGPIGRLEMYRNPQTGKYPVQIYQDVHDNLNNKLNAFGDKIKGLQAFQQNGQGDMNAGLVNQSAPVDVMDLLNKHRAGAK